MFTTVAKIILQLMIKYKNQSENMFFFQSPSSLMIVWYPGYICIYLSNQWLCKFDSWRGEVYLIYVMCQLFMNCHWFSLD